MSGGRAAVLAVDGGNSKTDLALVSRAGELLAIVNGPTISHQQVPIETGMDRLRGMVKHARRDGTIRLPRFSYQIKLRLRRSGCQFLHSLHCH